MIEGFKDADDGDDAQEEGRGDGPQPSQLDHRVISDKDPPVVHDDGNQRQPGDAVARHHLVPYYLLAEKLSAGSRISGGQFGACPALWHQRLQCTYQQLDPRGDLLEESWPASS